MKIAVYCGSSFGTEPAYCQAAQSLGAWLAEQGHTLVYGGGEAGLMGEVAKAAQAGGSRVVGVVPGNVPFICNRPQPYCTEVITTPDMATRKQCMLDMADAFIALPGGIGTLDEISEVITLTRIGVFDKPSVLLDVQGFYAPLHALFDRMEETGFVAPGSLERVLFSADLTEIGAFLNP